MKVIKEMFVVKIGQSYIQQDECFESIITSFILPTGLKITANIENAQCFKEQQDAQSVADSFGGEVKLLSFQLGNIDPWRMSDERQKRC